MEQQQASFIGWAIVEVFGHQRYAGYVTTEHYGAAALFRVDVPPLEERERVTKTWEYTGGKNVPPGSTVKEEAVQGYSKLFGAGAIYALTPCTQEVAEKAVASMQSRKLTVVSLAPAVPQLPPADDPDDDSTDDDPDEEPDADSAEL